nr:MULTISPECIES: hypothetical protein [Nocardiopsis]
MTSQTPGQPATPRAPKDEVSAALQTSRELGPDYDDAVAASLADKLDAAIDARVREHVAAAQQPAQQRPQRMSYDEQWKSPRLIVGIIAMVTAIPLTAISGGIMGLGGVALAWLGLLLVYIVSVIGLGRR